MRINENPDLKPYAHLVNIDHIYGNWFYHKAFPGMLNRAENSLRQELLRCLETNNLSQVWENEKKLLEHARKQNLPDPAAAEIEVACAVVEHHYSRYDQAMVRLNNALTGFLPHGHYLNKETLTDFLPKGHQIAVTRWLLGIVQWDSRKMEWEAYNTWTRSHEEFAELSEDRNLEESLRSWYIARRDETNRFLDAINQFIYQDEASGIPAPSVDKKTAPSKPEEKQPENAPGPANENGVEARAHDDQPEDQVPVPIEEFIPVDYLRLFSIVGEIPAGDPGQSGYQEMETDEVVVDRVMIGGEYFQIYSLKSRDHLVNLKSRFPVVMKVIGTSMNRVPLNPGDYVVINRELIPQSGDVVYASVVDEGVTLKKYSREGNKNVLRAVSDDPAYAAWPNRPDEDLSYDIRGVVVARLVKVSHNDKAL